MKKLQPATPAQRVALDSAIELLTHARADAAKAAAPRLLAKIRSALKSADGARRHLYRRLNAYGAVAVLALALVAGACATAPMPMPKPPLTINIEDGSKWFILPIPESTLAIGDRVCFWAGSWQYATLAQDRGAGVWRLVGSDRLLTPENYAGKMILLPAAQASK